MASNRPEHRRASSAVYARAGGETSRGVRALVVLTLLCLVCLASACGAGARGPSRATAPQAIADAGADGGDGDDGDEVAQAGDEDEEEAEDAPGDAPSATEPPAPCPRNMVLVATGEARFCVDKYEGAIVEVEADGTEKPHPHWLPVDGRDVRAVSEPDVFPQGFISENQAEDACRASGKRLCSHVEWKTACKGPASTTFPYGDTRRPGACHDTGKSAVAAVFGLKALADPVATTTAKKPASTARSASAGSSSAASRRATSAPDRGKSAHGPRAGSGRAGKAGATASTKTASSGRRAHATTGRAAQTTRPRAARPGVTAKAPPPKKKKKSDKAAPPSAS
ncbi:MAG TPA: SUMF1/EgtB/PvdO family nonheme iron enzyme, partial [Gaiellaceae bacterium]|nr:SUMF1/EgtB/PvdO family nonheme iron enzyme [Gaiellaceae bacterium]